MTQSPTATSLALNILPAQFGIKWPGVICTNLPDSVTILRKVAISL
eukprot:CAMPEP_0171901580 /NCGR_PEP_ID=MMETSP0993-20121228/368_1 /TAXON_ID=483369 /ORGANISM="non described non described, Strain CCMP2098" /LENGTH=45 /DNA_ID= /DNA_START= /DNA_END= /DNA_ORIENTATION=